MACSICGNIGGNECPRCDADYCDNCWYVERQTDIWRCADPFKAGCEQAEYHITKEQHDEVLRYENNRYEAETYGSDERFFFGKKGEKHG